MDKHLLLIEDIPSLPPTHKAALINAGYNVQSCRMAPKSLALFDKTRPRIVLLGCILPDRYGIDLMREILHIQPETHVIVLTASGALNLARDAMDAGAQHVLPKPVTEQHLLAAIRTASPIPAPSQPIAQQVTAPTMGFIGSSDAMQQIYRTIGTVATSQAPVFITGESGTGKSTCAQAIHDFSNRAKGPFVPVHCGAIPDDALESEVFGALHGALHRALHGAFTDAPSDTPAGATLRHGGTLFLDDICEMSLAFQTKLLRFLQTSTNQEMGDNSSTRADLRIICATSQDPLEQIGLGRLRADLFYRLYVVPMHLPPLRQREGDVLEIAQDALIKSAAEEHRSFEGFAPEVADYLRTQPWPGNVHQLQNLIHNIVVLNDAQIVTMAMLPTDPSATLPPAPPQTTAAAPDFDPGNQIPQAPASPPLDQNTLIGKPLGEIERIVVEETIAQNSGSIPIAARVLAVSPSTLYRKIAGWTRQDKRDRARNSQIT